MTFLRPSGSVTLDALFISRQKTSVASMGPVSAQTFCTGDIIMVANNSRLNRRKNRSDKDILPSIDKQGTVNHYATLLRTPISGVGARNAEGRGAGGRNKVFDSRENGRRHIQRNHRTGERVDVSPAIGKTGRGDRYRTVIHAVPPIEHGVG